ncbi:phosphatase 2C-like domain-containing protein [Spinellus fusiger]|nr:phosphatase 2C-like domain-containing protein [Spinellus fusiger]
MGQTLSEPVVDKTSHSDFNKHLAFGVSSMQGWRLTMEDAHATLLKLEDSDASFFGVYDGHGGATVAQYTGKRLHRKVYDSEFFAKQQYSEAMRDAYMNMDKELREDSNYAFDPSGCTAVSALVTPDQRILVANAGDSRSIISVNGKSKALSYDHKPVDRLESQRIIAAGGFVEFGRVNGNLALSRAIGDFEFKRNEHLSAEEQIVTCNPDIIEHAITEEDEFFVLACDGIWDCMTNQEVVDMVRQELAEKRPLEKICELIMDHCLAPDSDGGGVGCDNMSIMIIGILHGKTVEEWHTWMASRVAGVKKTDSLGNTQELKAFEDKAIKKTPTATEGEYEDQSDEESERESKKESKPAA